MKDKFWRSVIDFLLITVGAAAAAIAIEEFLVPCLILDGGVEGVCIMLNNKTGWSLALLTIILNIPFLLIGVKQIGKRFFVKAIYAIAIFSAFLKIFENVSPMTDEYLLAVCFGGVILGAGVGLVIRGGGCLDGTEVVAIMINKKSKVPVGTVVFVFNVVIYTVAGFLFGFDRAMYSLLTYFIASRILDIIEGGLEQAKAAMIITNDAKEVAEKIYSGIGRTCTIIEGEGLVSGRKTVLYCVLTRFEVHELKSIINSIDSSAFVAISDVSEIIGNHVKKNTDKDKLAYCGDEDKIGEKHED